VNADWLGAPRLRTLCTIGARGIKTWRAFGVPSHFLNLSSTNITALLKLLHSDEFNISNFVAVRLY